MKKIKHIPQKEKKPPTREMKGLQMAMGGVFLLIVRLMVTNGLDSLSLLAAGILFAAGFVRWGKIPGRKGALFTSLVLALTGGLELVSAAAETELQKNAAAVVLTTVGLAAALYTALCVIRLCISFCEERRAKDTADILRQRKWWVVTGYTACGIWALVDALTGLYPNVGVIMRIAAILVDIFFLSALFQVRKVLDT